MEMVTLSSCGVSILEDIQKLSEHGQSAVGDST